MAGKTYVTKGYSTHTNIPVPQNGYDHGPKNRGNQYTAAGFTNFVGSPSKAELLKEYVHAPSMSKTPIYGLDYENSSPPKYHGEEKAHNQSSWPMKTSDFSTQNKYRLSSPVHGYASEEARLTHSRSGIEEARHGRSGNNSGSNKSWQSAGPPATNHPLTGPTNNIKEVLGFLEESVYYSPCADPRRRRVLDELSTRAQPIEPLRRYARPAFVTKPNDAYNSSNTGSTTINSHEGKRWYRLKP